MGTLWYFDDGVLTLRPALAFDKYTIAADDIDTTTLELPGPFTVLIGGAPYEAEDVLEITSVADDDQRRQPGRARRTGRAGRPGVAGHVDRRRPRADPNFFVDNTLYVVAATPQSYEIIFDSAAKLRLWENPNGPGGYLYPSSISFVDQTDTGGKKFARVVSGASTTFDHSALRLLTQLGDGTYKWLLRNSGTQPGSGSSHGASGLRAVHVLRGDVEVVVAVGA